MVTNVMPHNLHEITEPRLAIKNLGFGFGGRPILREVNLQVAAGEMVCLVGPNGSGKSTLLRCADRILPIKQGQILVEGEDLADLKGRELARRIGYVPQYSFERFPKKVLDVVLLGRLPHMGFRVSEQDRLIAWRCLEVLGVSSFAQRYFDELSGGEQQKVVIARVLAQKTGTLLLDEPTSNLDLRHQLEVLALLRNLGHEHSLAILIAIHDLNLASRFADRLVLISEGRVRADGPPAQVLTADAIQETFGITARVEMDQTGKPYVYPLEPVKQDLGSGGI